MAPSDQRGVLETAEAAHGLVSQELVVVVVSVGECVAELRVGVPAGGVRLRRPAESNDGAETQVRTSFSAEGPEFGLSLSPLLFILDHLP